MLVLLLGCVLVRCMSVRVVVLLLLRRGVLHLALSRRRSLMLLLLLLLLLRSGSCSRLLLGVQVAQLLGLRQQLRALQRA